MKDEPGADLETYEVGPDEVIHFEKGGQYQSGGNSGDEPVVAVALGVPHARHHWAETAVLFDCAGCGRETIHDVAADDPIDERMPDADKMTIT